MSLGIAGFDSGIVGAEQFDYTALMRRQGRTLNTVSSDTGKTKFVRKRTVYLSQLMTRVPFAFAEAILSTSGVAGRFLWRGTRRHSQFNGARFHSREEHISTTVY